MRPNRSRPPDRGFTLLEMLFVIAIMAVVVAMITNALIDLDKTSRVRTLNATMQGEGRDALQFAEHDIRQASYGASKGIIWTQDALGNLVLRPAVQVFDNVPGGGQLPAKPGTDAILVVGVAPLGGVAAAQGTSYSSTATLGVTTNGGFAVGDRILAGSYQQAAWSTVAGLVAAANPAPPGLTLSTTQNIWPDGKLDAGAMVRGARARLYFVDTSDELVRVELNVPRAPGAAGEILGQEVVARGFENLQVECETDNGSAIAGCPAASTTDPTATEAAWALGNGVASVFNAGTSGAPGGSIGTLRSVVMLVVVRSQSPARDQQGDAPIQISGQTLQPGLSPGATSNVNDPYLRRSYRLPVAVRNVSLGVL